MPGCADDIDDLEAADIVHTADIATNAADIATLQVEVQPIARGGTGATDEAGAVAALLTEMVDALFPVGSVKVTTNNVNPGTYLTGTTWVAICEGRAIVGVGDNGESTWTAGLQQGAEEHTF